jgi:hypothetical protein
LIFFKKYKLSFVLFVIIALVSGIAVFLWMSNAKAKKPISYNKDIRPILSDKCFSCHGPDVNKMKAGLRLDLPEKAYAELPNNKGHFAIVPGSPEKSELIRRIESTDPNVVMPQPASHLERLTPDEINLF